MHEKEISNLDKQLNDLNATDNEKKLSHASNFHFSPIPIVQNSHSTVWYSNGLHFKCTGCGKCCTGFPGAVWVSDEELQHISEYLQEPLELVKEKYTRLIGENERRSLKEIGKNYDCVFLIDKKMCRIYEARPKQCRTYPWWPHVLESRETWEEAKSICEGIEHESALLIEKSAIDEAMSN